MDGILVSFFFQSFTQTQTDKFHLLDAETLINKYVWLEGYRVLFNDPALIRRIKEHTDTVTARRKERTMHCTERRVKDRKREGKREEEDSDGGICEGFGFGLIRQSPVDLLCDLFLLFLWFHLHLWNSFHNVGVNKRKTKPDYFHHQGGTKTRL